MEGNSKLNLVLLADTYAVCRLDPRIPIPAWAFAGGFSSVTRSDDELSIVCPRRVVPEGIVSHDGWRCFKVEGPLDFSMTGVISTLSMPLASAGISIFVVATYETDYLLVPQQMTEDAMQLWAKQGHRVRV